MADEAETLDKPPQTQTAPAQPQPGGQQPATALPTVDVNATAPTKSPFSVPEVSAGMLTPFGKEQGKEGPAPIGMSDLDAALRQRGEERSVAGKEMQSILDARKPMQEALGNLPTPKMPALQNMPQSPRLQMRSALETFRMPMMWLGIAGSLLTRRPLINAMAAATGMMEGFEAGDKERIELEQQKFKNNMQSAIQQNGVEVAKYKMLASDREMKAEDIVTQLRLNSAQFQDKVMLDKFKSNNFEDVFATVKLKADLQEKMLAAQMRWDAITARTSAKTAKQTVSDKFQKNRVDKYMQTIDAALEKVKAMKGGVGPQVGSMAGATKLATQTIPSAMGFGGSTAISDLQRDLGNLKDQYGQVFARKGRTLSSEMKNLDTIIPGSIQGFNISTKGFHWPSFANLSEVENALSELRGRIQTQYGELAKGEAQEGEKSKFDDMSDEEMQEELKKRGL